MMIQTMGLEIMATIMMTKIKLKTRLITQEFMVIIHHIQMFILLIWMSIDDNLCMQLLAEALHMMVRLKRTIHHQISMVKMVLIKWEAQRLKHQHILIVFHLVLVMIHQKPTLLMLE